MTMWTWMTAFNILCTILPVITFASPATVFLPTLLQSSISTSNQNNNAIEMPPLALTTQMLQCFLFAIYAHHIQMMTVFIPNIIGFSLGFVWSTIYPFKLVTSDNGLRLQWQIQYTISILVMMLGACTIRTLPYLSSTIGAVVGVLMCTYPLPSMHQAYKTNKSNLMGSSLMNFTMLVTCFVWVVHSSKFVEYDVFVLVPNVAGVVVQGGAMLLRVVIARRMKVIVARAENAELSVLTPLM